MIDFGVVNLLVIKEGGGGGKSLCKLKVLVPSWACKNGQPSRNYIFTSFLVFGAVREKLCEDGTILSYLICNFILNGISNGHIYDIRT